MNKPILKTVTVSLLTFLIYSPQIFANVNASDGFYIGGSLSNAQNSTPPGTAFNSSFNLLGRGVISPFVGYHFNDYLAVESSYNSIANDSDNGTDYWGPDHYRLYTIDLSAKLIMPFYSGISLFALPGIAFAHEDAFNKLLVNSSPSVDQKTNALLPQLGAGISYNFTENVSTELFFKHAFGMNNIGDINMLGLGLSYTFGKKAD